MKKIYLLIAVIFSAISLNAQSYNKGDMTIGVAVGLPATFDGLMIPPVSVVGDYMLKPNLFNDKSALSVGAVVGVSATSYDATIVSSQNFNTIVGGRAALHYDIDVKNLDLYAGVVLGLSTTISRASYGAVEPVKVMGTVITEGHEAYSKTNTGFGFGYSTFVGASYKFAERLSAFAEVGYGISYLQVGIGYKL